jgi:hypothetical protein
VPEASETRGRGGRVTFQGTMALAPAPAPAPEPEPEPEHGTEDDAQCHVTLAAVPSYILLNILTATAGESTHPTGSIHVLDGHDLAHLAAACTAFAHPSGSSGGADDFQGRSVTEEAARLMLRAYRVAGLVFPKDAPSKLDNTPRRCAVPTPAGTITLPWPAALGSRRARAHPHDDEGTPAAAGTTTVSEAHVILIANERRVDTTPEGRRMLQTARDDVPPDGATAIVRRGSACMQANKQVTLYCCILT